MKSFFHLIFLVSLSAVAQINNSFIIGKWHVVDIENKALITYCFSNVSYDEIDANIKEKFCNASIEFLNSNKILYRDKNNKLHNEKECLHFLGIQEFKWFFEDDKLKLRHSDKERHIKIEYHKETLMLNFVGIIFTLKK